MRVFIGGVPTIVPARWYWCAPGALPWPGPHGCSASPWLGNGEVNLDWGEVTPFPTDPNGPDIRGLDRGLNPGYPGQCFVGDPQWFIDGQLPANILADPVPPMVACCLPSPATATGGLVLGGSAVATRAGLVYDCFQCPLGAPSTWQITVSGGTGSFAQFNGVFTAAHQSGCAWNVTVLGRGHSVSFIFGGWQVRLENTTTHDHAWYNVVGAFDCLQGSSSWAVFATQGTGTVGTVTVSP